MKIKRHILVIKCEECPYLSKNNCENNKRKVKNIKIIPGWCKLEAYEYIYYDHRSIFDEYGNAV